MEIKMELKITERNTLLVKLTKVFDIYETELRDFDFGRLGIDIQQEDEESLFLDSGYQILAHVLKHHKDVR